MLKRSVFVVTMAMHLLNWIVWFHLDNWFVIAVVACDGSFHLVSYVRHLGQAFAQHNHLAQLNRHRYVVFHPNVLNSRVAVNVAGSHVRMPT